MNKFHSHKIGYIILLGNVAKGVKLTYDIKVKAVTSREIFIGKGQRALECWKYFTS